MTNSSMKWREEWWEKLYYRIDSQRSQKYIEAESRSILDHLDFPPGSKILDVGCGYGNHSFMLEQLGMQVFSVDISMFFAGLVQERKENKGSSLNFVLGDMRYLPFKSYFDGVINLYSVFGSFCNRDDDVIFLEEVFRVLRKGGRFILGVDNKSFFEQGLKRKGRHHFSITDTIVKGEWEFEDESHLLKTEESILKDNKQYKSILCQKLYSLHEISDISRKCNLNIKHIFSNLCGDSFKKTSEKMVLVMEK